METKSRLEKWWDETLTPKPKAPKAPLSALQKLLTLSLRKPKRAPNFTSPSMQRGVQIAKERKQRPARLEFIRSSQRQAIENAAAKREAYLIRRGKRWRGLVEEHLPRAFAETMRGFGLGAEVGSGSRI